MIKKSTLLLLIFSSCYIYSISVLKIKYPITKKEYYANKKIRLVKNYFQYKNLNSTPLQNIIYYDKSGKVMRIEYYNGLSYPHIEEKYYQNIQKLKEKIIYYSKSNIKSHEFYLKNGIISKMKNYYKNGKIKNKKKFNKLGIVTYYEAFYENGEIKGIRNYNEGKKTLGNIFYKKTKNLKKKIFYDSFEKKKKVQSYYDDSEKQKIKTIEEYNNGVLSQINKFDSNNILKSITIYTNYGDSPVTASMIEYNGDTKSLKEYYKNGSLKKINIYNKETLKVSEFYSKNGKLKQKVNLDGNGATLSTIAYSYYKNNKLKESKLFGSNGEVKIVKKFGIDGSLDEQKYSKDGKINSFKRFGKNGIIIQEQIYNKNGRVELLRLFYKNGNVKQEQQYNEKGKMIGVKFYDKQGNLTRKK